MQFYENMKLEVIAAALMTDHKGDKPKAKQTEAEAKNTVLNDTSELCVVWDNKCSWLLSQFDLDTVTSDQKHPDMNHIIQYFRASKSYATEVYFYEQQMCS